MTVWYRSLALTVVLVWVCAPGSVAAAASRHAPAGSALLTIYTQTDGHWSPARGLAVGQPFQAVLQYAPGTQRTGAPRARLDVRHFYWQGPDKGVLPASLSLGMRRQVVASGAYRFTATGRLPLGTPLSGAFVSASVTDKGARIEAGKYLIVDPPAEIIPRAVPVMSIRQTFAFCAHQDGLLRRTPRTRSLQLIYGVEVRAYYYDFQGGGSGDFGEVVDNSRYVQEVMHHLFSSTHGIASGTGVFSAAGTLRDRAWNTLAGSLDCYRSRPVRFTISAALS